MGLKDFRARVLAKADALDARADRMDAELAAAKAEREVAQARAATDAQVTWFHTEAARLGVNHEEMAERASRLGIGLPAPHQSRGLERVANGLNTATSVLPGSSVVRGFVAVGMAADGGMEAGGQQRPDPYSAWVALIRIEERVATAGNGASKADRALLRMARWAYKRS